MHGCTLAESGAASMNGRDKDKQTQRALPWRKRIRRTS